MSAALDDVARVVCNSRGLAFGEKIGKALSRRLISSGRLKESLGP